jgi:hypothetical protein
MGFSLTPLINLMDLDLIPTQTKIGLVGNAVLANGVLEDIDYTYWATIGVSITFLTR